MTTRTDFKLKFNIQRQDSSNLVYYKQDGQRFDCEETIKMKTNTPYKFNLTFQPAQKIKTAAFKGEELEVVTEESTPLQSRYSLNWNSADIPVTKKNRRLHFILVLELENMGALQLQFQFKFYDKEGHSSWGKHLNHIEYDCAHNSDQSFVQIVRDIFR